MARKRSRNSRLLTLGALAAAIVVGAWVWREIAGAASPTGEPARVVVPRGASVRVAAESLSARGVIGSPRLFRLFARMTGAETTIKPGTYQFATDAGYRDVLDALVTGRGLMATVVIPEGFDLRDITPALSKALHVPADSVRAAVTDTTWLRKLEVPVPSLEGYLFPATYTFPAGTTARDAVDAMIERFLDAWKPEWDARLQAMSIARHDAITMASIVEKEARKPEERPIISAVYWNRVKKGMRLQADPTVQYALPQHVARVLYKDLEVDSKYNTYRYAGLPPGPIASPGEASIAAALSPADVPYLFFVARPDGGHEFRTTFAEHSKAIARIKQAKRAAAPAPR
ncbi:MAG: endolytic transglycosylase MltG [Gemmatimonadaceae bacterium]|jgi:UPF0755 protein|nr:endolytic transglycosylase MltG [Gemmatimonadota bacterium]